MSPRNFRRCGLPLLASALAACAPPELRPNSALAASPPAIALVCDVGSRLHLIDAKNFLLTAKRWTLETTDWHISEHVCTATSAALRKRGINIVGAENGSRTPIGWFELRRLVVADVFHPDADAVRHLADSAKADLVLVVGPARAGDPISGTGMYLPGFGIFQQSLVGLREGKNYLRLMFVMLDGATSKQLATASVHATSTRPDPLWIPRQLTVLDQPNAVATRAAFAELIVKNVDQGVAKLRF